MLPPSWAYGIDPSSLLTMLIGVLLGATLGTIIGTEIAYKRTERWLRKLLTNKEFQNLAVEWLKRTAQQFEDEYVKPKIESEEFRELVRKAKEQAVSALFGGSELPDLEEFLGGGDGEGKKGS